MNRTKRKLFKGLGAIVLTLTMLITMIPATEAWADTTDTKGPKITSLAIDKQGETLESGEVTITFTAVDESGFPETNPTVNLVNASTTCDGQAVSTTWETKSADGTTVTYSGSIDVTDLVAGEWYVADISISDAVGNNNATMGNRIESDLHYFYRAGDFTQERYNNITVSLKKNYSSTEVTAGVESLPRRAKLSDIFGDTWLDTLPDDSNLGKFVGWTFNGMPVTKDSEILIEPDKTEYYLLASYQKDKYNYGYMYYNEDLETDWMPYIEYTTEKYTYADLMEDAYEIPVLEGYNFIGWDYTGSDTFDSYEYVDNARGQRTINFIAQYDKYPVTVGVVYVDEDNNVVRKEIKKDFPHGTTLREAYEQVVAGLDASITADIEGWNADRWNRDYLDDEIGLTNHEVYVTATYSDKVIVSAMVNAIVNSKDSTDYGVLIYDERDIVIDKELAYEEEAFMEAVETALNVDFFDQLINPELYIEAYDTDRDGYYETVESYGIYDEQVIVNLWSNDYMDEDYNPLVDWYYVAKPGEAVYLPAEYDGEKVYWFNGDNCEYYTGSFVIPADAEAGTLCWLEMYTELPEDAIVHNNPTKPVTPTTPSTEESVVKMDEEKIAETTTKIEETIKEAEKNGSADAKPVQVVVDMKKEDGTVATEVPAEILEVAKGKNVDVVLDMGQYSWTINGNDITATDLKAINLEVKLDTQNVPKDKVASVAGENKVQQLSLTHNGDFGFKAALTINVGKENEGQYGNLYYYNKDGKLEFIDSGKIDKDGKVSLDFTHASDYVVVIAKDAVVPETGDNTNIVLYVSMLLVGAGLMAVSLKKRNVF